MTASNPDTSERVQSRRRHIMRVELTSAIGCALVGAAFLTGGHTLREMSIFVFGWAFGCAFHLAQTLLVGWITRRRSVGRH